MTRRLPQSIKAYTAFIDGIGMLGITTGGKLPVITMKTEEYRDGGMDGSSDLEFGIEKMEPTLQFAELNRTVLASVGSRNTPITLRGSMEDEYGAKTAVIANYRGLVTEVDPGEWGEAAKNEVGLALTPDYYRLTIGGVVIYEIDIIGGVRIIDGVDQLAQRRANLGL